MFDMWIMELGKILHLERIRFIKEKKEHVFEQVGVIYYFDGQICNCAGAS